MSTEAKQFRVCNCNRTMPLDGTAIADALGLAQPLPVHQQLCQRELGGFADSARGDLIVACTQEAKLFSEVADEAKQVSTIRFVNIREHAGWSHEAAHATPKIAALLAAASLPDPEPVVSVSYRSQGQLLIVGPAVEALAQAALLCESLSVTVLATDTDQARLPITRDFAVHSGKLERIDGWLGAFTAVWTQTNPIDLDACTRCGACVRACPEHAIEWNYQIDLDRCRDHRQCVVACGEVKAIDFERTDTARQLGFDLVLDLEPTPVFPQHQPPQGYFHPGPDPHRRMRALLEISQAVGEFEKPRYFAYKESICAHSRSKKTGCTQCIDVCSTAAIAADGDHVRVEPHLCLGCGACATVCPSGALTYQYPRVSELGARLKTLLATYRAAGGRDACLLLHDAAGGGDRVIAQLAREGSGLPARVIPFAVYHVASVGADVWLGALAYGASQVAVLFTGKEAPQYRAAVAREMHYAEAIVQALDYQGTHLLPVDASDGAKLEQAFATLQPALCVRVPAVFNLALEKRTTLDMTLEHLLAHAPTPREMIPLPSGAPFGSLAINRDACTMCLACVGSCPEGALLDGAEAPQLRFIERNCVQCGLCANTCPENAITLQPRLLLTPEAKHARVLNEAAVFQCVSCGKPFGTQKMIEAMLAKIGSHAMWQQPGALERLKMCADCRVRDMMKRELV